MNSEYNQFIGVSRGRKTTKIHAIVDTLGNPVHLLLTGGQVHDAKAAIELLSGVEIAGSNILADKAYGSEQIRGYIIAQGAAYTIPPKDNMANPWACDFYTDKERHLVECFSTS